MKRVLTMLLAAPLLVGLAACSDSSTSSKPTASDAVTSPSAGDAPETTGGSETSDTKASDTTVPETDAPVTSDDGVTIATDELGLPVIGANYSNAAGGYSISFPDTPQEQSVPVATAGVTAEAAVYETNDGAYAVIYFDMPAAATDPETTLKAALTGSAGNVGITDLTFTANDLDGNPGWHAEGSGGGAQIFADAYLVGPRVYEVFYVGDSSVENPLAAGFLATFELLG